MGSLGKGLLGQMAYVSQWGAAQKGVGVLGKGPTWVRGCVLGHPGVYWGVMAWMGVQWGPRGRGPPWENTGV